VSRLLGSQANEVTKKIGGVLRLPYSQLESKDSPQETVERTGLIQNTSVERVDDTGSSGRSQDKNRWTRTLGQAATAVQGKKGKGVDRFASNTQALTIMS
jgi:hypothetical protein